MPALHALCPVALASALRRREITPLELLDCVHAQHDACNPELNALVALDREGAREAARASERRLLAGKPIGPLDGIPVSVKDNLLVRGLPATWGSALYRDFVPAADEVPIARLRSQGAVILGKTNVPQFTLQGYTSNALYGPTHNPWETNLTPGGSSGGAAAAVAAGIGPLALGTDGGGSIRRPAGFTGLVGLKPSIGRLARGGGFPEILYDLEVVGILGRSVAGVRLAYEALSGPDEHDRRSWMAAGMPSPPAPTGAPPRRIRLVTAFQDEPVDGEIVEAVERAARELEELGHQVDEHQVPFSVDEQNSLLGTIFATGLARLVGDQPVDLHESLLPMLEQGRRLGATDYAAAIERLWEWRRESNAVFGDASLIMTPTSAAMPWPSDRPYPSTIAGRTVGPRGHAVYTGFVNLLGLPGVSLPAPRRDQALPVGFQLVGRFGSEALLLDVAQSYEKQCAWVDRWPALSNKSSSTASADAPQSGRA